MRGLIKLIVLIVLIKKLGCLAKISELVFLLCDLTILRCDKMIVGFEVHDDIYL